MIKVYGYNRSGIHFACAAIYYNFDLGDCKKSLRSRYMTWADTNQREKTLPWGGLYGSTRYFTQAPVDRDRSLCIVRHPMSCLYSLWRTRFSSQLLLRDYLDEKTIQEWYEHVNEWIHAVPYIRYEDLVLNYMETLSRVGATFDLKQRQHYIVQIADRVGWNPGEAALDYRVLIPEEVRRRFREVLPYRYLDYEF